VQVRPHFSEWVIDGVLAVDPDAQDDEDEADD
jgi:hypothetical protein